MANRSTSTFTEVELEFMQLVWERGEVTAEDIQQALHEQGRELADGSVRKVLSILMKKGHLSRERVGRGYVYKAKVVKEQAHNTMLTDLLDRAFSDSAPDMVATLLRSRDLSEEDLSEIKKLIASYEQERGA